MDYSGWNGMKPRTGGRGRGRGKRVDNDPKLPKARGTHSYVANFRSSPSPAAPFEQARLQHAQASKQALERSKQVIGAYESSSDEEDLDEDKILSSSMKTYRGALSAGAEDVTTSSTTQYLYESCQSGSVTCLVCISSVKRQEAIWNCISCYAIFHLGCIQRWVRQGTVSDSVLSDELFPNKERPWFCPKCRYKYKQQECPTRYTCHCGKVEDPEFDPWLLPHTCGATCDRALRPECGHRCLLLCHPGPCPPCPKTVKISCYCGKKPGTIRRCGAAAWSCGLKCNKFLACGKHRCQDNCHSGSCPDCIHTGLQSCVCGKHQAERPCAELKWMCTDSCGKILSCGMHTCQRICHDGECGDCPRSGSRTCPCGKSGVSDLPCTEDVPTCNDTCGKSLGCSGGHKCTRRCHYGSCGPCPLVVEKKCRCGKRKKETPCHREFTCDVKCQKLRDCGNHQCKRKCCDGQCPTCEQICGRTLRCKRHKCQSRCHQGPCYPCVLTSRINCKCGSTGITVICGKEKTTKPPRCKKLCKISSSCHHPTRQPHNCHFGDCPKCTQVCGISLECGHVCPADCHDEVVVKTQVKAAGPWELPYQAENTVKCLPCPPCRAPVSKQCFGLHETADLPCFEAKRYCCGRKCGRLLECGNHKCSLLCHIVEGAVDVTDGGENCAECAEPCVLARPEGCTHACPNPCHPGPCPPCKKRIRQRCHCGLIILHHVCNELTAANAETRLGMESCGNNCPKLLSCGHPCALLCHKKACSESKSCKKKVNIRCPCKRKKKEFLCFEVQKGAEAQCDDVCKDIKAKADAEEKEKQRKKREEEERLQQIELDNFDRKMQKSSKSRRKRRLFNQEEAKNGTSFFHSKFFSLGFFFVAVLVLLSYSYYLFIQVG